MRRHLRVPDVVKKSIAEDEFFILRVNGNELAPCADTVGNDALRIPHVESDKHIPFGSLDRPSEVLGYRNGCFAIHRPADCQRHSAFGHQKQFVIAAWLGYEAVPQCYNIAHRSVLEPLKPSDQLREARVRFVKHTFKTLIPERRFAASSHLDVVAITDDTELRRRDADATPIRL